MRWWWWAALALVAAGCTGTPTDHAAEPAVSTPPATRSAPPAATTATSADDEVAVGCGSLEDMAASLVGDLATMTWDEITDGTAISDPCLARHPPQRFTDTPWPVQIPEHIDCRTEYPGTGNTRPPTSAYCFTSVGPLSLDVRFEPEPAVVGAWRPTRVLVHPNGPYCPEPDVAMAAIEAATPDGLVDLWGPCLTSTAIDELRAVGAIVRDGPCAANSSLFPSEWRCPIRHGPADAASSGAVRFGSYFTVEGVESAS